MRKLAKDGTTWTPSEAVKRDRLLRQFSKRVKGYAVAISPEFREGYDAIDWSMKVEWVKCPACAWQKGAIGEEENNQATLALEEHWVSCHDASLEELWEELNE